MGRRRGRGGARERPLEGVPCATRGARLHVDDVQPATVEVLVQRACAVVRFHDDQPRGPLPLPVCRLVFLYARQVSRGFSQQLHRQGGTHGASVPSHKASARSSPPQYVDFHKRFSLCLDKALVNNCKIYN